MVDKSILSQGDMERTEMPVLPPDDHFQLRAEANRRELRAVQRSDSRLTVLDSDAELGERFRDLLREACGRNDLVGAQAIAAAEYFGDAYSHLGSADHWKAIGFDIRTGTGTVSPARTLSPTAEALMLMALSGGDRSDLLSEVAPVEPTGERPLGKDEVDALIANTNLSLAMASASLDEQRSIAVEEVFRTSKEARSRFAEVLGKEGVSNLRYHFRDESGKQAADPASAAQVAVMWDQAVILKQSPAMSLITVASVQPGKMAEVAAKLMGMDAQENRLYGRIPAHKDEADMLRAFGFRLGIYDADKRSYYVSIAASAFAEEAERAEAIGLDLSSMRLRDDARVSSDDYPATVEEIEGEMAWCEFMLHQPPELARKPEKLIDLEVMLSELRWDRIEKKFGQAPVPVTVVVTDAHYPVEYKTSGLLLSGKRLVIDYPFKGENAQVGNSDFSQFDRSHIVVDADGTHLPPHWNEITSADISEADFVALGVERQKVVMSFARGEERPGAHDVIERLSRALDNAPWDFDPDTGAVVRQDAGTEPQRVRFRP